MISKNLFRPNTNYSLFYYAILIFFSSFMLSAQSPGGVANDLQLWLKTDVGLVGSTNISEWADQSTIGNNVVQGMVGFQPEIVANGINFHPMIDFDGTNDNMTFDNDLGLTGDNAFTLFGIMQMPTVPAKTAIIATDGCGDGFAWYQENIGGDPGKIAVTQCGTDGFLGNTVIAGETTLRMVSRETTGPHLFLKEGGNQITGGDFTYSSSNMVLGETNGLYSDIHLSELLVFNRALSSNESSRVHSYLSLKYGTTLDQTSERDYLASDATIIWDASSNSGYASDIFGIGRDDASGLSQKVSKSVNTGAILTISLDNEFTAANNDAGRSTVHSNDKQFMMVANNGETIDTQTTELDVSSGFNTRLAREWKADVTNFTQNVNLKFDGFDETWSIIATADGDFSSGVSIIGALNADGEFTTSTAIVDGLTFTLAKAQEAPGGILSDLSLWLKADSGVSEDTNGLDSAEDGDEVLHWSDSGPNTYTAIQDDGNQETPNLISNSFNYGPGLTFNGTDEYLSVEDVGGSNLGILRNNGYSDAHFYAVFKANDDTNTLFSEDGVGGDFGFHPYFDGSPDRHFWYGDGTTGQGNLVVGSGAGNGSTQLFSASNITSTASESQAIRNNGLLLVSDADANVINGINAEMNIGAEQGEDFYMNGEIAELIIYLGTGEHTTETQKIESYLALKYGLTLDQTTATDYLASDATIIWDASSNSGYASDIFGIGRDNASGLNQKVSRSVNTDAILTVALDDDFTAANNNVSRTTAHTNDKQFLMIAHNNGATSLQTTELDASSGFNTRLAREWKVDASNFSQNVSLKFEGYDNTWSIITKADGDFSSGVATLGSLNADGEFTTSATIADGLVFTLAKSQSAPGGVITNLQLWLSADDIGSSLNDGDTVNTWENRGLDANGDFNTPVNTPSYEDDSANLFNFNPVVYFGGDDYLRNDNTNFGLTGQGAEVFSVTSEMKGVPGSGYNVHGIFGPNEISTDGGFEYGFIEQVPNGIRLKRFNGPNMFRQDISIDVSYITSVSRNQNTSVASLSVNGQRSSYGALDTGDFNSDSRYYVGCIHNNGLLNANLPELIAYDRELSTFERNKVESYLAVKYGFSLDQTVETDYIASDGTVIWDASNNTGYDTTIFGIGRDDLSGLNQRVSKSIVDDAILTMALDNDFTAANSDAGRTIANTNDKQFLFVANDSGATTTQTTEIDGTTFNTRITREWKVDKTANFSQDINLKFTGFDETWSLVTDADGDFSGDVTLTGSLDTNGEITGVSLTDGVHFTLAKNDIIVPTITSFDTQLAGNGETVILTGTGFTGITDVTFGGVDAKSFAVDSDTQITAVVDTGASGNISVTNSAGNDSEAGFIYKVAQYDFENDVLDATNNNHDGTEINTVTYETGAQGQAVCFDNGPGYVELPDNLIRSLSEFTISLRFKTTESGAILGYQNVAANTSNTPTEWIPILLITSDGKLKGTLWTGPGGSIEAISANTVNDGNWHQVDFVGDTNAVSIYLDGNLEASQSGASVVHLSMSFNQLGFAYTNAYNINPTTWEYFEGCIDDLVIIDRALTALEIEEVTSLPEPTIISFTPTEAGEEDAIVITGTNFDGATQVAFGGDNAASYTVDSATQITAIIDTGATGDVTVTTAGGTATASGFTFTSKTAITTSVTSLNNIIYCGGQVSSSLNFNVSAIDAYQDLVITAPAGFEVSLNENTGFAPSITITPVTNAIADTTVYTRVATGQTGRLSGNISLISGTVTANVAVIAENNNSLYFDGVDDYVTLAGNTFADGITAFTIEAWILPDNSNWDGAYHAIFGLQDNGSPNSRNPSFYILDGRIHIDSYEDVTNNRFDILTDEPLITQNVWSHIALVKQGNLFTVYVNGQAEFTTAAPNAVNIVGPYNIGFIDNYFAGKIDDIRFWDISRTASEIANNMNTALTGNETGLVDNYTFNEGVSEGSNTGLTALPDNSVSSNDGTLNNFALNGSSSNWVQGYFSQISGEDNVAIGGQTQLTHLESGGVWASDDTDFATVTQSGLVTGVALGTVEISYTLCGQITVKNIEVNNPPGFTVSETTLTIDENAGTDTFTVVLNGQPASDVVFDVSSDDTDEAIVSSPQLTFTMANWNTPQTITVTGVDDTEIGNDSAIITVALNAVNSDDAFDELSNQTVAVTLTNDGDNLPVFTNPSSDYDISTAIYISADRFRVFDQESQPFGLAFNNTGSKMYIIGRINSTIYEYALSNPYNQSSATLTTSFSVFNEETDPYEIVFNANGSKMFITGPGSDKIIEYNLSTPFDISSATHMASDDFDVKNETNFAIGLEFNNDGTKMFVLSLIGDQVLAYDLNVAYDVSTAVYANKTFYIGAEHDSPQGITFNNLGTKMFIIGNGNSSLGNQDDAIVEYSLGTPYDIETAVYNGDDEELKVGAQDGQPTDVVFDSTGDYVYILGYNDDNVDRYAIQKQLQFEENSIMIVTDVDANDGDGGGTDIGITYSLLSGGDNDLFAIDGATGEISFISSPDFENPQDVNVDNNYIVTFTATDSDGSTSSEIIVIVNDVVETVSFNIDEISETNVDENATYTGVIPNITGTPIGTVSYTLSGNDAADFTIDSTTGVVSMVVRNFESPEDDDADNVYEVTITATDEDGNTDSEDWTVTVNNVAETASFTIDAIANANINENSSYTSVTPNITGSSIGNVTYILGGADAADFTINANSGVVSMVARDFENPEDDNTDNVYELSIIATDDDDNNDSENWTVTVDNLTETASFTIDAIANTNINENSSYTSTTPNITGSPIGNVTYTLGGSDAADFTIDSATGVVSMVVRNFESPEDDDTDNLYEVAITATDDDGNTDSEDWTVTIEDVSEITSFTINAIADDSIDEETPYTGPVPSITGTPVGIITYSLGGADAAIFSLDNDTGQVFMPSRSFENPDDVNGDNGYEVSITATDEDGNNATEAWTITLIDIVEVSNFTINTIFDLNVEENAVYTSVIPTLSGEAPIGHITYTLSGVDATSFTVNSITGVVSMVLRDFENPADNNTDNVYEVTITATDQDANTDNEDWTVTIDNVTETLSFTIDNIIDTEVNENVSYTSATPSITGNPVGNITYSLNGTDASDFTINTATGVVRMVARNFENPEDNNADNVYEVSITVTDDDGNTDGEDWTVTINNITEEDVDTDGDGIPDDADDFPNDPDEDTDTDGDGTGDNEDDDDDGDGTLDDEDAFPKNPDEDTDTDGDGIGDNEDEENNLDRDGDGVPDSEDAFPDDSEESVDQDGDGVGANKDLDDNNRNIREEQLVISAEAFTPNGDGINDTWIIQGIQNYPNALVTVYNRYGHEVFKAIGYQNDWSGRSSSSSENLPAGSYYYVINLGNGATPVDGWIFINY